MKINQITLKNFKGFKEFTIPFDPQFNLIIGDNGSGKSAILEALTIAMGSFFLGIKDTDSRNIKDSDIRLVSYENSEEPQFPVEIITNGTVNGKNIEWTRHRLSSEGSTRADKAKAIKLIAEQLDKSVRGGELVTMPVLAYYSTGRLWRDLVERKTKGEPNRVIASRFRAYKSCLQSTSTFKIFVKWYKGKELSSMQKKEEDISLRIIKELIISNLPNCKNIFYEFDEDKIQGIKIVDINGYILPFEYLSDGTRNLFALLADIAYKCLVLNPHLKEKVLEKSIGIVLIDELDLHLHPEWQKQIIVSLKKSFPGIQFITSSHSPFLIQETGIDQLIVLKNNEVSKITSGVNLSIEDIAEDLQEVINPQWSKLRQEMFDVAKEYYKAVKEGRDTPRMKEELDKAMKPFVLDTAFYSIIEEERLIRDSPKK